MLGLEHAMAAYLHLAKAEIRCKPPKVPQISVVASDTKVRYDHTKYQNELDQFDVDTVNPYGDTVQSHVGGLMSGRIEVSQNMRFMQETYPALGTGCIHVAKVDVRIHIDPTIYIARDYPKGGCMYNAIMEHEKKHIRVDREIVNKYTGHIVKGLNSALKQIGFTHGPMSVSQIPAAQEKVNTVLSSVTSQYAEYMNQERRKLQQQIDTIEEYERVRKLCPEERRR